MTAVEFQNVRFSYPSGVEALRGVTLSVDEGERLAIIGQNGAGKTTLVRHLNGIHHPTSGTVTVGDVATTGRSIADLARLVGYAFQNPDEQLFAATVRADVAFGPRNFGCTDAESADRAMAALASVGLAEQADTHPLQLSLSERKRVALAGVLAMQTPVVVMDEPTTGQDAAGVQQVAAVVESLGQARRTVIAITHDMDFAAEHFDRVVVMAEGRVLTDGPPGDMFGDADALARAGVEPPQLLRLAGHLGWEERPLTVAGFVEVFGSRVDPGA